MRAGLGAEAVHAAIRQGDADQGVAVGFDAPAGVEAAAVLVEAPEPAGGAGFLDADALVVDAPAVAEVEALVPAAAVVGAGDGDGDAADGDFQVGKADAEVAELEVAGEVQGGVDLATVAAAVDGAQLQGDEAVEQLAGVELGDGVSAVAAVAAKVGAAAGQGQVGVGNLAAAGDHIAQLPVVEVGVVDADADVGRGAEGGAPWMPPTDAIQNASSAGVPRSQCRKASYRSTLSIRMAMAPRHLASSTSLRFREPEQIRIYLPELCSNEVDTFRVAARKFGDRVKRHCNPGYRNPSNFLSTKAVLLEHFHKLKFRSYILNDF